MTATTFDRTPWNPLPHATNLASAKQIGFLNTLLLGRDVATEARDRIARAIATGTMTKALATKTIDQLKALPTKQPAGQPVEPGFYQHGDRVVRVKKAQTGRTYALELSEDGQFVYAPGLIREITTEQRMTLEQAAAYGKRTGTCLNCGRTLTDPDSIARGIGPICAGNF